MQEEKIIMVEKCCEPWYSWIYLLPRFCKVAMYIYVTVQRHQNPSLSPQAPVSRRLRVGGKILYYKTYCGAGTWNEPES